MPRQLSDHEFVAFDNQINVDALDLPPWGGVVQWEGMEVLVFEAPGGLYLTDISDIRASIEIAPPWEYNPLEEIFVWHLPKETAGVIVERAGQVTGAVDFTFSNLGLILALAIGLAVFLGVRRG